MKALKLSFIIAVAALAIIGLGSTVYAFHSGGVAACEGCHTMHNSYGGVPMGQGPQFIGNVYYLQGTDQSSTCLNCHATTNAFNGEVNGTGSFHIATYPTPATGLPPSTYSPGGDFAWIQISTTGTTSFGEAIPNPGTRHGHNIIAQDYGYTASTVFTTSPGGSYPVTVFYCSSCHDPHGKYRINSAYQIVSPSLGTQVPPIYSSGSYGALPTTNDNNLAGEAVGVYRILGGKGYLPDSLAGSTGLAFGADPIVAVAPSSYNKTETDNSGGQVLVAYGMNASPWCGNCHQTIHQNGSTGIIHPTGMALTPVQINIYNAYVYSGNLTGLKATANWSMVPFERDSVMAGSLSNLPTLATYASTVGSPTVNSTTGPSSGDQVVCLSCHRAHASGWKAGVRFQTSDGEFLTLAGMYPGIDQPAPANGGQYNLGYTAAQVQATFYGRPASVWATYQRSLCDKCHAKD